MELEELKTTIKGLSVDERRKLALYILELEKEYVKDTIGPQIAKDVDDVSRIARDAFERLRQFLDKRGQ
jgi:hypothetical protein